MPSNSDLISILLHGIQKYSFQDSPWTVKSPTNSNDYITYFHSRVKQYQIHDLLPKVPHIYTSAIKMDFKRQSKIRTKKKKNIQI